MPAPPAIYLQEPLRTAIGTDDPFAWLAQRDGESFRDKGGRRTFRFEHSGKSYFAKLHVGLNAAEACKELASLRTPPLDAGREARALLRLEQAGVAVPHLVGWGISGPWLARRWPLGRRSFVITEDVGTQRTLGDALQGLAARDHGARRDLTRRVAKLVRAMHGAGVNHRDLYFGHVLAPDDVRAGELILIDLHRAQVWKRIPQRWIVKDLGSLAFASLGSAVSRTDRLRFIAAYAGTDSPSQQIRHQASLWARVEARVRRTESERLRKGSNFGG